MNAWSSCAVLATQHTSLYGDRVVRCFDGAASSLYAMFDAARQAHPQHDAMVCDELRWSYAQLADEAASLSAGFAACGIRAGDRVVMLLGNRPEFLSVLLALQRLGAISVPVGVRE
ncbi:MAG: AMP-binding protein, partial [Rubrivivax sp.]